MQRATCIFNARTQGLDVRYRSLPLLTEMADGFGAPRYGLCPTAGPHRFSRRATRHYEKPCCASFLQSMPTERLYEACEILHVMFHESHKPCSLLEMGTSPFLDRLRSRFSRAAGANPQRSVNHRSVSFVIYRATRPKSTASSARGNMRPSLKSWEIHAPQALPAQHLPTARRRKPICLRAGWLRRLRVSKRRAGWRMWA